MLRHWLCWYWWKWRLVVSWDRLFNKRYTCMWSMLIYRIIKVQIIETIALVFIFRDRCIIHIKYIGYFRCTGYDGIIFLQNYFWSTIMWLFSGQKRFYSFIKVFASNIAMAAMSEIITNWVLMQLYHTIPPHNIFHSELFLIAVSKIFATPHISLINGFS